MVNTSYCSKLFASLSDIREAQEEDSEVMDLNKESDAISRSDRIGFILLQGLLY